VNDPGGAVFIGPVTVYVSELFAILGVQFAGRALGSVNLVTAGRLLSLTWAAPPNFAAGYHPLV
jgi:hypothetical protein